MVEDSQYFLVQVSCAGPSEIKIWRFNFFKEDEFSIIQSQNHCLSHLLFTWLELLSISLLFEFSTSAISSLTRLGTAWMGEGGSGGWSKCSCWAAAAGWPVMMEEFGEQIIEFMGWWITEVWFRGITPPPSILSIGIGDRAGITSLIITILTTRLMLNRLWIRSDVLHSLHWHSCPIDQQISWRQMYLESTLIKSPTPGLSWSTFALRSLQSPASNEQYCFIFDSVARLALSGPPPEPELLWPCRSWDLATLVWCHMWSESVAHSSVHLGWLIELGKYRHLIFSSCTENRKGSIYWSC